MRAERKRLVPQVAGRDFRKNCAGASLAQLVEHSAQPRLPCALAEIRISLASYRPSSIALQIPQLSHCFQRKLQVCIESRTRDRGASVRHQTKGSTAQLYSSAVQRRLIRAAASPQLYHIRRCCLQKYRNSASSIQHAALYFRASSQARSWRKRRLAQRRQQAGNRPT